jgi:RimJ/RimL family protein N-acetyltransferase
MLNSFPDRRLGELVPDWTKRAYPPRTPMMGRICRVEPLVIERHAQELYSANAEDCDGRMWDYLKYGPFPKFETYLGTMRTVWFGADRMAYAIVDLRSEKAIGCANYLHIDPDNGSIEVGAVMYSPVLRRTLAATEAMYLMMNRVFGELLYRRYEWKCNSLNHASRTAASRLGFSFEGVLRQNAVVKGRNRDTACFSIMDFEWPRLQQAFDAWLREDNFDQAGQQLRSLGDIRSSLIEE